MLFAILAVPAILTATINAHQLPTPESLGGQPGQAVACHIDRVAACKFKSLYQFENQGSPESSPKYPRTTPALADLTSTRYGRIAQVANPFTWAAWAEYRLEGTGLAWTPRDVDGKPKGVAFNILGNESPEIVRIQTCQISHQIPQPPVTSSSQLRANDAELATVLETSKSRMEVVVQLRDRASIIAEMSPEQADTIKPGQTVVAQFVNGGAHLVVRDLTEAEEAAK